MVYVCLELKQNDCLLLVLGSDMKVQEFSKLERKWYKRFYNLLDRTF
jgi:hypothetical protein